MIKKRDILIFTLVAASCIAAMIALLFVDNGGMNVQITEQGNITHTVSLYENQTIRLPHNTVVIENGEVRVSSADCKNQICVNTPKISSTGEQIICLPNQVIIEVIE